MPCFSTPFYFADRFLVDRSYDRLCIVFPDLIDDPNALLATCTDMLDPATVAAVMTQTLEKFGRVDVLAHTVGGYRAGQSVEETPMDTWDFLIDLNVKTALIPAQQVLPVMRAQGRGKIVCVAARSSWVGQAQAGAYSAAKAGLLSLVESLSAEVGEQGINVNCILPGTIDTPQKPRQPTGCQLRGLGNPGVLGRCHCIPGLGSGSRHPRSCGTGLRINLRSAQQAD